MNHLKFFVLFFLFTSLSAKAQSFSIVGTASNFKDSTWIYLRSYASKAKLDSCQIVDGKFNFKGKSKDGGCKASLNTTDNKNSIQLWLEPKVTAITFNNGEPDKAIIKGSATQTEYQTITKKSDSLKIITDSLYSLISTLKEYDKIQNNFQQIVRLQLQSNLMYTSYIKQTPNSILAASFLMDFNSRIEKKETKELYSNLSEENKQSYYGQSIKKYLSNKSFDAGEKLNDFKLINTTGKKIRLSEVKGEYILLDFWASWCAGCREEFPRLIKTYQLYKNNGFNVIGISLDINKNDWLNAIKSDQLPWENVGDLKGFDSKIALGYGITGLPEKLLIDKKGTIIGKIESLYQLEEKLKELYK